MGIPLDEVPPENTSEDDSVVVEKSLTKQEKEELFNNRIGNVRKMIKNAKIEEEKSTLEDALKVLLENQ